MNRAFFFFFFKDSYGQAKYKVQSAEDTIKLVYQVQIRTKDRIVAAAAAAAAPIIGGMVVCTLLRS